jgi:hypothetical protein
MGQAYAGLHPLHRSGQTIRQATKLKDDDADIFYDLGTALTKLAQYDEAVAHSASRWRFDPENYRAVDGLEEAREGVQRIKAGKKHQEDLLKKQQKEENKNANGDSAQCNSSSGSSKSNSNSKST